MSRVQEMWDTVAIAGTRWDMVTQQQTANALADALTTLELVKAALMQREHFPVYQALDVLERFDAEWLGGDQR
ncbi:MAG: hypothetical protein ACRDTJ_09270 [Pseudonocardiaceae bacterium]